MITTYENRTPPVGQDAGERLRLTASLELSGRSRASGALARKWLESVLKGWRTPVGVTDDLQLIASELVTNALEHTDSHRILIHLVQRRRFVLVAVVDCGPCPGPLMSHPPAGWEEVGGRGLWLVEQYAHRWGYRSAEEGTLVWASVPLAVRP